jgi:hypothetical protein
MASENPSTTPNYIRAAPHKTHRSLASTATGFGRLSKQMEKHEITKGTLNVSCDEPRLSRWSARLSITASRSFANVKMVASDRFILADENRGLAPATRRHRKAAVKDAGLFTGREKTNLEPIW